MKRLEQILKDTPALDGHQGQINFTASRPNIRYLLTTRDAYILIGFNGSKWASLIGLNGSKWPSLEFVYGTVSSDNVTHKHCILYTVSVTPAGVEYLQHHIAAAFL